MTKIIIPTYLINLKRDVKRKEHTLEQLPSDRFSVEMVEAVDGRELSQKYIAEHCDMEALEQHPTWLTPGAIGCALSHLDVYERIIEKGNPVTLILEDDKTYQEEFYEDCCEVMELMHNNEVVLMYFESYPQCWFSSRSKVSTPSGKVLAYPTEAGGPITTGAYLVTLDAAKKLRDAILPVRVAADTWHHFIAEGCVDHFRCIVPMPVRDANFKSSIGYTSDDSLRTKVTKTIEKHRIPIAYQLLKISRSFLRIKRLKLGFVDEPDYRSN